MKRIVYTLPDCRVSVLVPTLWCMKVLCNGGHPWPLRERQETDKMVRNGRNPDLARRWIRALMSGGCTSAEAYGLIRDKDMKAGWMAPELVDTVSADRWFRNAWTRSPEGGPIWIDLDRAYEIQASSIHFSYKHWADRAKNKNEISLMAGRNYFREVPDLDPHYWRRLIRAAKTPPEIKSVWPDWLPRPPSPAIMRAA